MRAALDRALSALARLMLRIFFRSVEVKGVERIPRGVPLLIVANHVNSVVDPLLLMAFADGRARMLAKSTLWSHPVMGPLLVLAGALPVYRRQDAGQDVTRNFTTFARCHETLARGARIALFPEGRSHNQPGRLPLKTGAARIALETVARHATTGLRILPVGLVYEAKDRFRSRALVNIGEPIDPNPEAQRYAAGARAAVRALTERLASGLESLTESYASWEEARLVELAASIAGPGTLAEQFARSRDLLARYGTLRARNPEKVAEFVTSLALYQERLREERLEDADVVAGGAGTSAWSAFASSVPLGAPGALLNFVPYQLTAWITRRFAHTPDEPATYMLLTGLLVFPTSWLATGILAGLAFGPVPGVLAAILGPALGLAALRLREVLKAREKPRPSEHLRAEREALTRQIPPLLARL